MTILDIEIPDSEIEKLAGRETKILYCLYEAHPDFAVTTWTMYKAGGTGFAARKRSLNKWLETYGLVIETENRSCPGHSFWVYWIEKQGELFSRPPRKFVGEIA